MAEELGEKIKALAQEKDCVILVHNYQRPEVQDVADFLGDSLDLARTATKTRAENILFCGVDFMAETAAILNPEKRVIAPVLGAKCPMAAMLSANAVLRAREEHPDAAVLLYVNTLAEAKAEADVVCTSANAVQVANALPEKKIIFGPDENLAHFVSKKANGKEIIPVPKGGHCCVHKNQITKGLLEAMAREHQNAEIFAHPECNPDVQEMADYILSTNGMVAKAKELPGTEFIIATERELGYRLKKEIPGKTFHIIPGAVCGAMKLNTLDSVLRALEKMGPVVDVPDEIAKRAQKPIERMLEISGGGK